MANKKRIAVDGNYAAAYAAYAFTEVAGIYPITPASPIAEYTDEFVSQGKTNIFGTPVKIVEMQSEAGAAGTVHGSLQAGALTTTYTASQGLLLKIPNMYKIAGECLPGVMHVAARSIAAQALSIFGDHQDVMAARQTGFALLASSSVQEVMDMAGVAHLAAIESRVPFLHFYDGFRTSHEVNTIEPMDYDVYKKLLNYDALKEFRENALSPTSPKTRGTAQNDDVYFQTRELQNKMYKNVPAIVEKYLKEISKITKREYAPFNYYGAKDATHVIVAIGSVTETTKEVIDYLIKNENKKVGCVIVRLYRPFSVKHFLQTMPKTVKRIAVLDRTIEPGSICEPLCADVKNAYFNEENRPLIVGGRYGLSSKDTTPNMINAVYDNLYKEKPKDNFLVGVVDDIDHTSLDIEREIDVTPKETKEFLFYGFGSDGTVGACKNISKIIGDNTNLYAQSYAAYDSRKSGGSTRLHLRFSKNPIRSTYLVNNPHFISCSTDSYVNKFDMIKGLRNGGVFLLNTRKSKDEIIKMLPNSYKRILAQKEAKFYIINATDAALKCGFRKGLGVNTIMQSAFFKLNEDLMPYNSALSLMKEFATKTYTKKGEEVVKQNHLAIELGGSLVELVEIDPSWVSLNDSKAKIDLKRPKFVREIADVVYSIKGDELPLSAFKDYIDAHMPNGATNYEKNAAATDVPFWTKENCIQCNKCAISCPHACIRPFLMNDDEVKKAPENLETLDAIGFKDPAYKYAINISVKDCTGCGVCIDVCPGKSTRNPDGTLKQNKALSYESLNSAIETKKDLLAEYLFNEVSYKDVEPTNPKNSQFKQPLFEYSGACGGCGETPYIKLLTQLFGEKMLIANATGCSSIYSGSFPSTPYTTTKKGYGPAWANSLFEDNAEFGFGMKIANDRMKLSIEHIIKQNIDKMNPKLKELSQKWIENKFDANVTNPMYEDFVKELEANNNKKNSFISEILDLKKYLYTTSQWIIGGDGWAYDIGYGGLDHIIANNLNVNILILDTEVYSNTGGQASKSSQMGAIAKFAAVGKPTKKKDIASIAMSYGHVYVAQVSLGYDNAQVLKAFKEAEAHNGPSLIVAYSPCIAHNIKGGLMKSQTESKLATECGYWPTFRFNPELKKEGKNPFTMDSKEPNFDKYQEFLLNEGRYSQLSKVNPTFAKELLEKNKADSMDRYEGYRARVNDNRYNN